MSEGELIVLDGPDGCGKSTQLSLLLEFLRDEEYEVQSCREPGDTPIGDRIREILLDPDHEEMTAKTEMFLYMASRAQLVEEKIKPGLRTNDFVLLDRYYYSTVAYQGIAGEMGEQAVLEAAKIATGGLKPDLAIFLDIPVEEGLKRLDKLRNRDRMEQKDNSFHKKVRQAFLQIAEHYDEHIVVIDAGGSIEEIHEQIKEVVLENF